MKKCIILANGKPPKKSIITFFLKRGYNKLICADGGANSALKMGLKPDVIIGDLDSISTKALEKFKSVSKIIKLKRQNDTDVEKCLKFAIRKKYDEALLLGATGNRLDHTFCNIGIVLKFFPKIKISLIAEDSFLKAYTGNVMLKTISGETISLYGISPKTIITSNGLKYELKNIALPFGVRESTSNIALKNPVKLQINNGVAFVIRDVKTMIENDLF
ncbi:MAG: thiamine diphosphokinase [Ignavibacteriaceae bacterium]|nr:thiamine diphosphokinase [Ignavibacteriaceae bacterium]